MNEKICCIIVTYNRLDKLKTAILSIENQTILPSTILIVNNNCSDGTLEYLNEWEKNSSKINKCVINLTSNIGGAGGFSTGMKEFLNTECDWMYIGDDDAYLDKFALEQFSKLGIKDEEKVGAICGKVMEHGVIGFEHRRTIKKGLFSIKEIPLTESQYNEDYIRINEYSFVGTFIKREAIERIGLPKEDYFIWFDDTEHSIRLNKEFEIYCVPKIIIQHDCPLPSNEPSWKNYYGYRNYLDLLKSHFPNRYFRFQILRLHIYSFIEFISKKQKRFLRKDAISDFKNNLFGISTKYKPGTKIK